nr:uncharacterized protein LOC110362498 isoform X4 [Columba livia]
MAFGGIYLCLVDQGQRAQISPAMAHLSTAGDSPRRRTKQQSCNSTEGHELEGGEVSYLAGRKDAIIAPSLTEDCKRRLNVVEASAGVGAIGTQQCGYKPSVMGSVSTWGRFLDPQLRLLSLSPHRAGQN